jgi:hypothetical protein
MLFESWDGQSSRAYKLSRSPATVETSAREAPAITTPVLYGLLAFAFVGGVITDSIRLHRVAKS